jgi:hypothetical protein
MVPPRRGRLHLDKEELLFEKAYLFYPNGLNCFADGTISSHGRDRHLPESELDVSLAYRLTLFIALHYY